MQQKQWFTSTIQNIESAYEQSQKSGHPDLLRYTIANQCHGSLHELLNTAQQVLSRAAQTRREDDASYYEPDDSSSRAKTKSSLFSGSEHNDMSLPDLNLQLFALLKVLLSLLVLESPCENCATNHDNIATLKSSLMSISSSVPMVVSYDYRLTVAFSSMTLQTMCLWLYAQLLFFGFPRVSQYQGKTVQPVFIDPAQADALSTTVANLMKQPLRLPGAFLLRLEVMKILLKEAVKIGSDMSLFGALEACCGCEKERQSNTSTATQIRRISTASTLHCCLTVLALQHELATNSFVSIPGCFEVETCHDEVNIRQEKAEEDTEKTDGGEVEEDLHHLREHCNSLVIHVKETLWTLLQNEAEVDWRSCWAVLEALVTTAVWLCGQAGIHQPRNVQVGGVDLSPELCDFLVFGALQNNEPSMADELLRKRKAMSSVVDIFAALPSHPLWSSSSASLIVEAAVCTLHTLKHLFTAAITNLSSPTEVQSLHQVCFTTSSWAPSFCNKISDWIESFTSCCTASYHPMFLSFDENSMVMTKSNVSATVLQLLRDPLLAVVMQSTTVLYSWLAQESSQSPMLPFASVEPTKHNKKNPQQEKSGLMKMKLRCSHPFHSAIAGAPITPSMTSLLAFRKKRIDWILFELREALDGDFSFPILSPTFFRQNELRKDFLLEPFSNWAAESGTVDAFQQVLKFIRLEEDIGPVASMQPPSVSNHNATLLVLGSSGSGKTFLLLLTELYLWMQFTPFSRYCVVPLFVSFNELTATNSTTSSILGTSSPSKTTPNKESFSNKSISDWIHSFDVWQHLMLLPADRSLDPAGKAALAGGAKHVARAFHHRPAAPPSGVPRGTVVREQPITSDSPQQRSVGGLDSFGEQWFYEYRPLLLVDGWMDGFNVSELANGTRSTAAGIQDAQGKQQLPQRPVNFASVNGVGPHLPFCKMIVTCNLPIRTNSSPTTTSEWPADEVLLNVLHQISPCNYLGATAVDIHRTRICHLAPLSSGGIKAAITHVAAVKNKESLNLTEQKPTDWYSHGLYKGVQSVSVMENHNRTTISPSLFSSSFLDRPSTCIFTNPQYLHVILSTLRDVFKSVQKVEEFTGWPPVPISAFIRHALMKRIKALEKREKAAVKVSKTKVDGLCCKVASLMFCTNSESLSNDEFLQLLDESFSAEFEFAPFTHRHFYRRHSNAPEDVKTQPFSLAASRAGANHFRCSFSSRLFLHYYRALSVYQALCTKQPQLGTDAPDSFAAVVLSTRHFDLCQDCVLIQLLASIALQDESFATALKSIVTGSSKQLLLSQQNEGLDNAPNTQAAVSLSNNANRIVIAACNALAILVAMSPNRTIEGEDFSFAALNGCTTALNGSVFVGCNFSHSFIYGGAQLSQVRFVRCVFHGATFSQEGNNDSKGISSSSSSSNQQLALPPNVRYYVTCLALAPPPESIPETDAYGHALKVTERIIAAGCSDGNIRMLSTARKGGALVGVLSDYPALLPSQGYNNHEISALCFTRDGKRLVAVGKYDGLLRVWQQHSSSTTGSVKQSQYALQLWITVPLLTQPTSDQHEQDSNLHTLSLNYSSQSSIMLDRTYAVCVGTTYSRNTSLTTDHDQSRIFLFDLRCATSAPLKSSSKSGGGSCTSLSIPLSSQNTVGNLESPPAGDGCSCACISPDGQWVAATTNRGCIVIWETTTGSIRYSILNDQLQTTSKVFFKKGLDFNVEIAFTPAGDLLCVFGQTSSSAREQKETFQSSSTVVGRHLKSSSSGSGSCIVTLWRFFDGHSLPTPMMLFTRELPFIAFSSALQVSGSTLNVQITRDARHVVCVREDESAVSLRIFDLTGTHCHSHYYCFDGVHSNESPTPTTTSPKNTLVFDTNYDGSVAAAHFLSRANATFTNAILLSDRNYSLGFGWDTNEEECLPEDVSRISFDVSKSLLQQEVFSHDGMFVARARNESIVDVFDTSNGEPLCSFSHTKLFSISDQSGTSSQARGLSSPFSPKPKSGGASANVYQEVMTKNTTSKELFTVTSIGGFDQDVKQFVSVADYTIICLWNVSTGSLNYVFDYRENDHSTSAANKGKDDDIINNNIFAVSFSQRDTRHLFVQFGSFLKILDLDSKRNIHTMSTTAVFNVPFDKKEKRTKTPIIQHAALDDAELFTAYVLQSQPSVMYIYNFMTNRNIIVHDIASMGHHGYDDNDDSARRAMAASSSIKEVKYCAGLAGWLTLSFGRKSSSGEKDDHLGTVACWAMVSNSTAFQLVPKAIIHQPSLLSCWCPSRTATTVTSPFIHLVLGSKNECTFWRIPRATHSEFNESPSSVECLQLIPYSTLSSFSTFSARLNCESPLIRNVFASEDLSRILMTSQLGYCSVWTSAQRFLTNEKQHFDDYPTFVPLHKFNLTPIEPFSKTSAVKGSQGRGFVLQRNAANFYGCGFDDASLASLLKSEISRMSQESCIGNSNTSKEISHGSSKRPKKPKIFVLQWPDLPAYWKREEHHRKIICEQSTQGFTHLATSFLIIAEPTLRLESIRTKFYPKWFMLQQRCYVDEEEVERASTIFYEAYGWLKDIAEPYYRCNIEVRMVMDTFHTAFHFVTTVQDLQRTFLMEFEQSTRKSVSREILKMRKEAEVTCGYFAIAMSQNFVEEETNRTVVVEDEDEFWSEQIFYPHFSQLESLHRAALAQQEHDIFQLLSSAGTPMRCISKRQWVEDERRQCCPICDVQFTFFIRRHHCRVCGEVVCADCSDSRTDIIQEGIDDGPQNDEDAKSTAGSVAPSSSEQHHQSRQGQRRGKMVLKQRICGVCVSHNTTLFLDALKASRQK